MVKKKSVKKNISSKKTIKKTIKANKTNSIKQTLIIAPKENEYKKGLLEVDQQEQKYDKLFEQKLAEQYREFRNLKEHHMQSTKFFRILLVLITVVLIALLLLSYRV